MRDAGHSELDAPKALAAVADGLAQAVLMRDSAFHRLQEAQGPITYQDRARRAFDVWDRAQGSVVAHARLLGLRRIPKPTPSLAEYLAARPEETEP